MTNASKGLCQAKTPGISGKNENLTSPVFQTIINTR
jgi:hypothetical protein